MKFTKYYMFNGANLNFETDKDRFDALQRILFALKGINQFHSFTGFDISFTPDGLELTYSQANYKAIQTRCKDSEKTRRVVNEIDKLLTRHKQFINIRCTFEHDSIFEYRELFTATIKVVKHGQSHSL